MNISWIGSPNYTKGRQGASIDKIVCHWMAGTLSSTDSVFQNTTRQTSAHYGVGQDGQVHQYVKESDTAWHAGNWDANITSVGIEHEGGPGIPITDSVYQTSGELIASIWQRVGRQLPLRKHSNFKITQCPGTLDLNRLTDIATRIYKGKEQVADQIILNADNWFNRCNKTIKFTRGREMSREEFAPQVGRKFINFVEDAEDFPEADEQLRRIEIGRANTVVDTDDWYNFTNKLMVAARGRKWGSRDEFRIQVNRPFNATASDIFSGEEYDNHQKKILNLATENATLKTENATLKAQANSGGINQDTVNTINETNSIVKSILSIVTNIWNAITRLWRV
jgi:hypothetical protein